MRVTRLVVPLTRPLLPSSTRRWKIYTRTGDAGETSLFPPQRRLSKTDPVFAAMGDTDELSSAIGTAIEHCRGRDALDELTAQLTYIQCRLQDINSRLATEHAQWPRLRSLEGETETLERDIDCLTERLPPLRSFVLPSGGLAATALHLSRAVCRRTERSVCRLSGCQVDGSTRQYLNRLSDYLFTAARFCAQVAGHNETLYSSRKSKQ